MALDINDFIKQKKSSSKVLKPKESEKKRMRKPWDASLEQAGLPKENKNTSNKLLAKREQTVSNVLAEPLAKREQTVSNVLAEKTSTVSNVLAEPLAELLAKREQTVSNVLAKHDVDELVGKERTLLNFIFHNCKNKGSLTTDQMTAEILTKTLEVHSNQLRNVIHRLKNKGFLTVERMKMGRSGWRIFSIKQETFQKLSLKENVSNMLAKREQTVSNVLAEPLAEALAISPSSSSGKKITTTTNNMPVDNSSDASWKKIQIPMFLQEAGLNYSHVQKIYEAIGIKFEIEQIQESLDQFAYDLVNKLLKARTSPLNFLMGVMVKNKSLYVSESQIEALRDDLKSHQGRIVELEQAKAQFEELEQQNLFEQWLETLSLQKRNEIVPPNNFIKENSNIQQALLKDFWKKHVQS